MERRPIKTIRNQVYQILKDDICEGRFAPGQWLQENELAERLCVSRSPIREALRQLEQEGLIEYSRNVGCSVKKITIEDAYEIYLLRANLEMTALRQFDCQFPAEDLAAMRGLLDEMLQVPSGDLLAIVENDNRFHRIIVQRAGLPRLLKFWDDLNYGSLIAGVKSGPYHGDLAVRQNVIHTELYHALASRDTEAACQAVYDHYMKPLEALREAEKSAAAR